MPTGRPHMGAPPVLRPASNPAGESARDGLAHVLGSRSLLALHEVELHRLPFGEGLEPIALDRALGDEAILVVAVGCDETKTLRVVEPLYFAARAHGRLLKDPAATTPCCAG